MVWLGHAVSIGMLDPSPYTDQVQCTITGKATQAAIGDVVVMNIDGTKSVKFQESQCFNIEDVEVGDKFTAIMVTDSDGVLQCLVRVK